MSRRVLTPLPPAPAAPPAPPLPSVPATPSGDATDTLARTLWGEARDQPVRAIEGVAAVVMNRVRRARERGGWWWGGDPATVCRMPLQFACWNPDGPGRAALAAVTEADPTFVVCRRIARRALAGLLADPTGGATHYHAAGDFPDWASDRGASAEIGDLLFYNDVE